MLVRDLMKLPQVCGPADTLARAAQLLWENDCGVVPVVDEKQRSAMLLTEALTQITGPRSAEDRPKLKTARKPAVRITNQRPPKAVTR
ncbi:MAG: hypothetical protein O3A20_07100 [Planctomycetota bacterium]|nr:hypothetical protein [Planctomycetota bacterium]